MLPGGVTTRLCCRWRSVKQPWVRQARPPPPPPEAPLPPGSAQLTKATAFTVGCCGVSFLGAAVWQYERMRREARAIIAHRWTWEPKRGSFRQQLNTWWHSVPEGSRVAYSLIAANAAVFLLWRVPRLEPIMLRYFVSHPASKPLCLPMFLSTFSHHSFFHLAANMVVLNSFAPTAVALLGREQFLAMYVSGGVVSSLASYLHKVATRRAAMSLGASGAILAVVGALCLQYPDAQLSIIFLPFFTFSAAAALKGVLVFDTAGMLLRWRLLDHAAHLGGTLFGVGYVLYGQEMWKRREPILKTWHQLRESWGRG
ncbi:rhomboid family intramembrane serine protease rho-7 [Dermacentor variabilis]|uniref:rhomboid family intramembrane serine protease rho-7 n=1 Tax=Dermacentor variabilis TaxID=34621 RepID=UPI003F5B8503